MSKNTLCSRLMGVCKQRSFHDLSVVKDSDGKPVQYLVDSEELALDFDAYAKEFSESHHLGAAGGSRKRTLCSTDAIYLRGYNDAVQLIEFKDDSVGELDEKGRFRFKEASDTHTKKNYELIAYRKFTETLMMLIADDVLDFDESRESISCILVLSSKNFRSRMSDLVRGPKQFSILNPLEGALFKSVFAISGKTFDRHFSKKAN